MKKPTWIRSFQNLLRHTDEKSIILKQIQKVTLKNCRSLLDIGAGDGTMAALIAECVSEYVAIEQSDTFVRNLKEKGLEVVKGWFPLKVGKLFDVVLISYTLPYLKDRMPAFVNEAWDHVAPQGRLVIFSNRLDDSPLIRLYREAELYEKPANKFCTTDLIHYIRDNLSDPTVSRFFSHVTTDTCEEMLDIICFMYSDEIPERKKYFRLKDDAVLKILQRRYFIDGKCVFPFEHVLIETKKTID